MTCDDVIRRKGWSVHPRYDAWIRQSEIHRRGIHLTCTDARVYIQGLMARLSVQLVQVRILSHGRRSRREWMTSRDVISHVTGQRVTVDTGTIGYHSVQDGLRRRKGHRQHLLELDRWIRSHGNTHHQRTLLT